MKKNYFIFKKDPDFNNIRTIIFILIYLRNLYLIGGKKKLNSNKLIYILIINILFQNFKSKNTYYISNLLNLFFDYKEFLLFICFLIILLSFSNLYRLFIMTKIIMNSVNLNIKLIII